MRGLFITGTDTGVGKTEFACRILRHLAAAGVSVGAYKPVCSGAEEVGGQHRWEDADRLSAALGGRFPLERIAPQRFLAPLAPPLAAAAQGTEVNESTFFSGLDWWRDRVELLLVEGAGGLLCPLTENWSMADLAREMGFPILIVSRATLGTINHTLLTIAVARQMGLKIAGVILNEVFPAGDDISVATNADQIEQRSGAPVLLRIAYRQSDESVGFDHSIDWQNLAGILRRRAL